VIPISAWPPLNPRPSILLHAGPFSGLGKHVKGGLACRSEQLLLIFPSFTVVADEDCRNIEDTHQQIVTAHIKVETLDDVPSTLP